MAPGKFVYFGIVNGIKRRLHSLEFSKIPLMIESFVNVDGLPISDSSPGQLWTILIVLNNVNNRKPFAAGIYYGHGKPIDANDFLKEFVEEANFLFNNHFLFKGKQFRFKISSFVCDSPARCFILFTIGHCGYYGCFFCDQKGEWEGRVVMPLTNAELRTDKSFRDRVQVKHHSKDGSRSILENIPLSRKTMEFFFCLKGLSMLKTFCLMFTLLSHR